MGCNKIALIGGSGYLGSHFYRFLQENNTSEVWVVGRAEKNSEFKYYRSSVKSLESALDGANVVVNFGSATTPALAYEKPYLELENIKMNYELNQAMSNLGVAKYIFISSGGTVYGDGASIPSKEVDKLMPTNLYGETKKYLERVAELNSKKNYIDTAIVRIANPYGKKQLAKSGQGVISYIIENIKNTKNVNLYGNSIRDYIYIDDVVNAIYKIINIPSLNNEKFNVGTGIGTDLITIVKIIESELKKKSKIIIHKKRDFDINENILSYEKLNIITGWRPEVDLTTGIKRLIREC